jgi:acyl-CoA reductase-like NAD-dependent aldehyde dehydrogenase
MVDEAFGPLLTISPVSSDAEAVSRINDSPYGLTASVWTQSEQHAHTLVKQLNVGTVFMNRCDFLDPLLPWSGRKDSGKGFGLSTFGFLPFIRTKGYNFKTKTS